MTTNNVFKIGGGGSAPTSEPGEVRARLRETLQSAGITQAAAARQIGISAPVLAQWLAGKYEGDNAGVSGKVTSWLDGRAERALTVAGVPAVDEFLPTEAGSAMGRVLSFTHQSADVGVIYGGAGDGKTTALRRYARDRPSVWLATMTPATAGLVSALEEVCWAIGATPRGSGAAALHRSIVERLRGSGGLLMIDEAQHLSAAALDQLRAISDAAGVGVVLSGNEEMFYRVAETSAPAFAQLASRIGQRVRLSSPTPADVATIAGAYGVTEAAAHDAARRVAREPGALRAVVKALRLAHSEAGGEPLTGAAILQAAATLRGQAAQSPAA